MNWTSNGVQIVHIAANNFWRLFFFLLSIRNYHSFVRIERLHVEEPLGKVGHSAIQRNQLLALVASFFGTGILASEATLRERTKTILSLDGPGRREAKQGLARLEDE